MPHQKTYRHQINLVTGCILVAVTLLVGAAVFVVMQRQAKELLSKNLQAALQTRLQVIQSEIVARLNITTLAATRPLLIEEARRANNPSDAAAARLKINIFAQNFFKTGLTAVAFFDEDGAELARAGTFTQKPALAVLLSLPGRVQLMWDEQLLLHAEIEIKQADQVIGRIITETPMPDSMQAFKDSRLLGASADMVLCAPFGVNMQCFPTTLNPNVMTTPGIAADGNLLPMAMALAGKTGFVDSQDYRGQDVTAAYAPVIDLGLGMVLKMDSAELNAPLQQQLRFVMPLLLALLIIALLALRWLLTPLVRQLEDSEAQARQLATSLRDSELMSRNLTEGMAEGVITATTESIVLQANAAALELFGYEKAELIGLDFAKMIPERHRRQHRDTFAALAAQPEVVNIRGREVQCLRKDGSEFSSRMSFSNVWVNGQRLLTAVVVDISEFKLTADRLVQLANYDFLTGLPKRVLFQERLEQAMSVARVQGGLVAVVFLDLIRFKNVNDTLGHEAGDQLLIQVAQRLLGTVRSNDTVARISGDEFMLVLTEVNHVDEVAHAVQRILRAFEPPFSVAGRNLVTRASLGISIFPLDSSDISQLLGYADLAMYSAKGAGDNHYQFYAAEMTARAVQALALENELRQGLERNEFFLSYQPIVDAGGSIVGAEALLRWQNGRRGLIPPASFIPLAETTGLILPIGQWVLRQACLQAKAWHQPNGALLGMSVNVSGRQFIHSEFANTVKTILAETGLDPSCLNIEITEGVLMHQEESIQELFDQLSQFNIAFSIDDFGVGYSNFAYLKRFPINSLKIDQSFIQGVTTDPGDAAIVKAIIQMAHSLGLKVVAEGVETSAQKEFLLAQGCDFMQGYYFGRPLLPQAFTELLNLGKPLRNGGDSGDFQI